MVLAERGWHDFSIYPKRSCTFRRTNPPLVYALCNDTLCRLRYQYKGLYISYTTYNNISYTTKWNNPLCGLFCLFVWLSQALRVTVNKYFIGFTSFKYYAVLLLSWSVQLAINWRNINSWVSVCFETLLSICKHSEMHMLKNRIQKSSKTTHCQHGQQITALNTAKTGCLSA